MKYFLLFVFYSVLGWLIEVIGGIIQQKKFVNRGFLIGPYCPIWGFGCIFIILLLNKYQNDPIALFLFSMLLCGTLEYATSFLMEKIFDARWWDYKNKKFNINGRICLETLIPFGLGGIFIIYILNPMVSGIISLIPSIILNILGIVLFIIFITDVIISFNIINNIKVLSLSSKVDSTEEISKYVLSIVSNKSYIYKRLMAAFPNFTPNIERIKKQIDKTRKKIEKEIEKQKRKNEKRRKKLKEKQEKLERKYTRKK